MPFKKKKSAIDDLETFTSAEARAKERLQGFEAEGYEIFSGADWRKIRHRYRQDKRAADLVPRGLVYFDIGVLCATIEQLLAYIKQAYGVDLLLESPDAQAAQSSPPESGTQR